MTEEGPPRILLLLGKVATIKTGYCTVPRLCSALWKMFMVTRETRWKLP